MAGLSASGLKTQIRNTEVAQFYQIVYRKYNIKCKYRIFRDVPIDVTETSTGNFTLNSTVTVLTGAVFIERAGYCNWFYFTGANTY